MEIAIIAINLIGSLSSFIGLAIQVKKENGLKSLVSILLLVLGLLLILSAFLSYKYSQATNPQKIRIEKIKTAKKEATAILRNLPEHISEYDIGVNEGILYSGLVYAGLTKDIFEVEKIRSEWESKLNLARVSKHEMDKRELLEEGAKSVKQFLISLNE